MFNPIRRFLFPYQTGAGCVLGDCPAPSFPVAEANCEPEFSVGGINELYFHACTETYSEVNVLNSAWWAQQVPPGSSITQGSLGRSGLGVGSISKKGNTTARGASCRLPQPTSTTWAIKFQVFFIDKTSAKSTCAKFNEMLNSGKWLLSARMCEGDDSILPVGVYTATDQGWTVPDNSEENQFMEIELSWKQKTFPCPVEVAGLSAVIPKLS